MDEQIREAFRHATAGDWRTYAAYVDRLLDEALDARHDADAADLERLYRAPSAELAPGGITRADVTLVTIGEQGPEAVIPFDHGAEW